MNILYCGDKKMCKGIFLSVLSICKNTNENLNIYILTATVQSYSAVPLNFAKDLENTLKQKISITV